MLTARSVVAIEEIPLQKLHVVSLANAGPVAVALNRIEVLSPAAVQIGVRRSPKDPWSAFERAAEIALTLPGGADATPETLIQLMLRLPATVAIDEGRPDRAVLRFSGSEASGGARSVSFTQDLSLPAPAAVVSAVDDAALDGALRPLSSDTARYIRALAESEAREQAVRTVLDAVLGSTIRHALNRRRFKAMVLAAARETADHGPESAKHSVFLAEAQRVLRWRG